MRYAISIGIAVGWDDHGSAFAMMTDRDSELQRTVFRQLMASSAAGDVLFGWYYPGNFETMQ